MERSQRTEEALEGTETTQRKGLERRDTLFGQVGCMVESLENLWRGLEEEVGRRRQATAEKLEEATERAGRKHLPQHSGSQGGGQGCL